MSYLDLTIKQIYGRSYNECNHPECNAIIIERDKGTGKQVNYGEIAHIRGRKPGAERYVKGYANDKLNSEENLILLCQKHHTMIDQKGAEKHYTIKLIEGWKRMHYEAKENIPDREWVYGASRLLYFENGEKHILEYWYDKDDTIRFFTPEQIEQVRAASDLSRLLVGMGSLMANIDDAEGTPADNSHISMNDSYVNNFKKNVDILKKKGEFESVLDRLYHNLKKCHDITLAELALVGSMEKLPQITIMPGESTKIEVSEVLKSNIASRKKK